MSWQEEMMGAQTQTSLGVRLLLQGELVGLGRGGAGCWLSEGRTVGCIDQLKASCWTRSPWTLVKSEDGMSLYLTVLHTHKFMSSSLFLIFEVLQSALQLIYKGSDKALYNMQIIKATFSAENNRQVWSFYFPLSFVLVSLSSFFIHLNMQIKFVIFRCIERVWRDFYLPISIFPTVFGLGSIQPWVNIHTHISSGIQLIYKSLKFIWHFSMDKQIHVHVKCRTVPMWFNIFMVHTGSLVLNYPWKSESVSHNSVLRLKICVFVYHFGFQWYIFSVHFQMQNEGKYRIHIPETQNYHILEEITVDLS